MTVATKDPRPPALVIRIELDALPRIYADAASEDDVRQLYDWLLARPDLVDLLRILEAPGS